MFGPCLDFTALAMFSFTGNASHSGKMANRAGACLANSILVPILVPVLEMASGLILSEAWKARENRKFLSGLQVHTVTFPCVRDTDEKSLE